MAKAKTLRCSPPVENFATHTDAIGCGAPCMNGRLKIEKKACSPKGECLNIINTVSFFGTGCFLIINVGLKEITGTEHCSVFF